MSPTDSVKISAADSAVSVCAASERKSLRGFTLIELIIVMAIIAILSGIMSLVISGFQRDARMETDNNKAHMIYTGFQDILTQCEMTQNDSLINAAKIVKSVPGGSDPNADKRLTYSIIRFTMDGSGIAGNVNINSYYDNTSSQSAAVLNNGSKMFLEFEDMIVGSIDQSFEGTIVAYLDVDNYSADSALYFESEADYNANVASGWLSIMKHYSYSSSGASKGKVFQAIENIAEQKSIIKNKGVYCGSYPIMDQSGGGYYMSS